MKILLAGIAAGLFGIVAGLSAQAGAPFVAKVRVVNYRIEANGSKTLVSVQAGTYARASDGTTMSRLHVVQNGQAVHEIGNLTTPDGAMTEIYFQRREAVLRQPARLSGYEPPFASVKGEHRTINGVDCVLVPMAAKVCTGPQCASIPIGAGSTTCVSPAYGTIVHEDLVQTIAGVRRETVRDTYDFVAQEPDPAWMTIPEGFTRTTAITLH